MYRRPKTSLFSFCIGVIPQLRSINGNSPKLDIFFCKFGLGLQHKLYGSTKGKRGWENSVSVRLEHSQHILRTEDKWRRRVEEKIWRELIQTEAFVVSFSFYVLGNEYLQDSVRLEHSH